MKGPCLNLTFCAAVILSSAACGSPVRVPPETSPTWPVGSLVDAGLRAEPFDHLFSQLPPDAGGLHSMLVVRHGVLALERYWNNYDANTLHDLRSATKSITALLMGIAIDRGLVPSVEEPIERTLRSAYLTAPALDRGITVGDLLTMRSGLDCDDRDPNSPGNEEWMYGSQDWVGFMLSLRQARPRGSLGVYCTGGVVLLGRILAETSHTSVPDFAQRTLFEPLGIHHARWQTFDQGRQTDTGGHLQLRPRDFALLGQLVLQRGRWRENQIISESWIEYLQTRHTTLDHPPQPYGALWWLSEFQFRGEPIRIVYASGNGGQTLFVIPRFDLVVAFTSGNYDSPRARLPFDIVLQAVLPAIEQP